MLEKSAYLGKTNALMLQIIISLLILSVLTFGIIVKITRSISTPIQNTIAIFKRAAQGDLTVTSNDYLPDEFGELIKNLRILLSALREIAHLSP